MRFELPTRSFPNLRSMPAFTGMPELTGDFSAKLTDAGHTVIGFAAMAAKQANDRRLGINSRFEPQVRDFRKGAVGTVKSISAARGRVADTVDPIVDRMVERFPDSLAESVSDTVTELRKVGRQTATTLEQRVIEAIEFATTIPAKPVRRAPATQAAATSTKAPARRATKPSAKAASKSGAQAGAQAGVQAKTKSATKAAPKNTKASSTASATRTAKKSPPRRVA